MLACNAIVYIRHVLYYTNIMWPTSKHTIVGHAHVYNIHTYTHTTEIVISAIC